MPWKNEPELTPLNQNDKADSSESHDPERSSFSRQHSDRKPASNADIKISSSTLESSIKDLTKALVRKSRWGFAFKLIAWLVIVGLLAGIFLGQTKQIAGEHTALVRVEGVIADGYDASAENVLAGLRNAYQSDNAKGIILSINSPGGSPVQSDILFQEIQRLKATNDKPLIAVINDIGASGGYYIAVSADKIYANPSSIVGSIGVLMNGFGFVDLMDKIGVERRLLTAGKNKGLLDPFSPVNNAQLDHTKLVIEGVHQQFIEIVRQSRGSRLKETEEMFSGLFWNGTQAFELGLTDGLKTPWSVARDDIGQDAIVDYTRSPDVLERFTKGLGASIAQHLKINLANLIPKLQ